MKIAFIHQKQPSQFRNLARWFGSRPEHQAVFLTMNGDGEIPGVRPVIFGDPPRSSSAKVHPYLENLETAILRAQAVTDRLRELADQGFVPDVVIGHGGWGDTLFVKELLPRTRLLLYTEFYYQTRGANIGFDPNQPQPADRLLIQMRNAQLLHSLAVCDHAWTPTLWQRSVHPPEFHDKIAVVHEGIDTDYLRPNPEAEIILPDGRRLTSADEVVTYVARGLEPCRGFPTLVRALPRILEARPGAQVLIVGSDQAIYGDPPRDGGSWREKMLAEVAVDHRRVHFLGPVPYEAYRIILQISSAHIYLSYPFVLSWSMLEAMSCGCLIVGSRTAPVEEVIEDHVNGLLVDFFQPEQVADAVINALATPEAFAPLRAAARQTVRDRYEASLCLKRQLQLIGSLTAPGP